MEQNYNKKQQKKQNEQESLHKFNAVTQKVKPENQNQEHNVRKRRYYSGKPKAIV